MTTMDSLRWLVLAAVVVGSYAVDVTPIKPEDKIAHQCEVVASSAVTLQGKAVPLLQCSNEAGARFLLAAESAQDSVDVVISGEALLKLREVSRPKRQFGNFGGGFGSSFSNANSFSGGGGFGGGGFGGGGFGGGGYPFGGGGGNGFGFSGASANAASFGGGFGG